MKRFAALLALLLLIGCGTEPPQPDGEFATVDGLKIHYLKRGGGERAVVLVHGFGSGAFTWRGIQERVPQNYTSYAVDLPGFGFSEKPENLDYGLPRFADTVAHFIAQQIGRPAVVAGNAMGGATSIWAAAEHPQWVAGIVPIDAAGAKLPEEHMPAVFFFLRIPVLGPLLFKLPQRFATAMTLRQIYGHPERVTDELIDAYYDRSRLPGAADSWQRSLVDLVDRIDGEEVLTQMSKIEQDVLILLGGKDPWVSRAAMAQFEQRMPHARLKVYDDLGHVPMEEAPDVVAPDIFGFADEVLGKIETREAAPQ